MKTRRDDKIDRTYGDGGNGGRGRQEAVNRVCLFDFGPSKKNLRNQHVTKEQTRILTPPHVIIIF